MQRNPEVSVVAMRDYNTIPFKSPRHKAETKKVTDHPLVVTPNRNEEKKEELESTLSTNSSSHSGSKPVMTATDALMFRREGAEATISKLRSALDDAGSKGAASKAAVAKSDAVILELRSSVRQLKRQLEKLQEEKRLLEEDNAQNYRGDDSSKDGRVGELQIQLDRAHAQILTADMVRKELEDTLEAEQYTWELRVQDQERTIQQLQQECTALTDDLEQCRQQWKESEDVYGREVEELQAKLEKVQKEAQQWKNLEGDSGGVAELKHRIVELEQERGELQGCLDEALKELEAVDAELQGDALRKENERLQQMLEESEGQILDDLKHLYRWLLERDDVDENEHTAPHDARGILAAIKSHLERLPRNDKDMNETRKQVAALESQLSVYRGDLKAREESSNELRTSLKEAVSLLKPLQDAVAKADEEKMELQRQLDRIRWSGTQGDSTQDSKQVKLALMEKDDEIDRLKQEIESLELELSRVKVSAASSLIASTRASETGFPGSLSKARDELRAKRASEKTLKQLLRDAQTRFHSLHNQNQEVAAQNDELQGRLRQAEEQLDTPRASDQVELEAAKKLLVTSEAKVLELQSELKVLRGELAQKDVEIRETANQLAVVERKIQSGDHAAVREVQATMRVLQAKLAVSKEELHLKKDSEKALKHSLKEALGLLKPLQMHLEEAENEKRELMEEIRELRLNSVGNESEFQARKRGAKTVTTIRDLQETVKHLELENSHLHDALEDMSQSINVSHMSGATGTSHKADGRLREEIVELKSRNEVTEARLTDALAENHSLIESLRRREKEEKSLIDEVGVLRERLKYSDAELENAKFIAASALVKFEEVGAGNLVQRGGSRARGFDHESVFKEKTREVEREMEVARDALSHKAAQYRLT